VTADPLEIDETDETGSDVPQAVPSNQAEVEAAESLYADPGAPVAAVPATALPPATPEPTPIAAAEPFDLDVLEAARILNSEAAPEAVAAPADAGDTAPAEMKAPRHHFGFHHAPKPIPARISWKRRFAGFALAFVAFALIGFAIVAAAAVGLTSTYANRIGPGIHAGAVDLSGLTRDQAIAKLTSNYSYLGQGQVTVKTPVGSAIITYEQAGRKPDVEAMADAAIAIGHSGNVLPDAATLVHGAAYGQQIPVVVRLDPTILAQRIRQLVGTSTIDPVDAQATVNGGTFGIAPATTGRGIDENAVQAEIIDQLSQTAAPTDLTADGSFVTMEPKISEADAGKAIANAQKMIVDVQVTWSVPPANAPTNWKPTTWTIPASEIRNWIVFGVKQDGTYGPAVDPTKIATYLATTTDGVGIAPKDPNVVFDTTGKPVSLGQGVPGLAVDPSATASAVAAYLDTLAGGGTVGASVEIVTANISPQIVDLTSITGMQIIGTHTTIFYPDISNGIGKNIRQPALNIDGMVIEPGQHFSFLQAVGPIDPAHGFAMGGVIKGGKSDHTGAMGGGICSASTTVFNAAAKAGLQIDERHAHYYYIYRYPVGRDATVYSDGTTTWDVRWTNDTPYPIVIRAWTTKGSASTITVQLWSWPTGRTVAWTGGFKADIIKAGENPPKYTSSLAPGVKSRAEYPTDGFKTTVNRVVTDTTGKVIHNDTWNSSYSMVNGQWLIGGSAPAPAPTPPPVPAPTPTPAAGLIMLPASLLAWIARRRVGTKAAS
jgi:vancomycin resistance protein YoaR